MTNTYFHSPEPPSTNLVTPGRVLAIGAHPDDIEFGAGATLAKWSQGGTEIAFVIMTDGSKGTWDPEANTLNLAVLRQGEARKAAGTIAGSSTVNFLGWTDGELLANDRSVAQLCFMIRKFRPNVVLGHDPWKRYRLHPDHRAAGFATTDAIVASRDPHFLPELGLHHRPDALLLFEADEPNHCEAFGEVALRIKIEALLCHRSQHVSSMEISNLGEDEELRHFKETVRSASERTGASFGLELGESFRLIREL